MRLTQPRSASLEEPCRAERYYPTGFFEPPDELIEHPHEGRLIPELRNLLRDHPSDPSALLVESAVRLAVAPLDVLEVRKAKAIADLAVTGTNMFEAFRQSPPRDAAIVAALQRSARVSGRSQSEVAHAVDQALDRAYRLALILRGWSQRSDSPTLGWFAVSGEDDPPHRPVNVPGPSLNGHPLFQYDLDVDVPRTEQSNRKMVRTRYVVAGHLPPPAGLGVTVSQAVSQRLLPSLDRQPVIPANAKIVLYIHGLDSRLEECLEVAPALVESGFIVISMDLPNFGYAGKFRHQDIADPPQPGRQNIDVGPYGALAFLEAFIVAFIDTLDAQQAASIKHRIVAVVGGSLGGNMGLRLAERGLASERWVHSIVSWSPGSTWGWSWERYGHADGPLDIERSVPVDMTRKRMLEDEGVASRREFFRHQYLPPVFPEPRELITESRFGGMTAGHSFRDSWQPCKDSLIAGGRRERREIYHEHVRQWHWRVANEQLVFMHLEPREQPRYRKILSRVLLGSGEKDNYRPEFLYDNTRQLATRMLNTPGHTMWLRETGHSFHNERPLELARAIAAFAPPPRPSENQVEEWSMWLSLGGEPLRPRSLTLAPLRDGRLALFAVDEATRRIRHRRPNLRGNWLSGGWFVMGEDQGVPEDLRFRGRLVLPLDDGRLRLYAIRADHDWMVHLTQKEDSDDWEQTDLGNHLRQLIDDVADLSGVARVGMKLTQAPYWQEPIRVHVMAALKRTGRIVIRGQNSTGWPNAYWNEQPNLGSPAVVGEPHITRDSNDRLHIFARRADNQTVTMSRESADRDQWSRGFFDSVGSLPAAGDVASCLDATGRLRVFVRAGDGTLRTISQLEPGGREWQASWQPLAGSVAAGSRPAVIRNAWGDLQVFVRTAANELATRREVPGIGWQAWQNLGGELTSDPIVGSNVDGTITVMALRSGAIPWFRTQTTVVR
jgi:pimeloyl-ACP methyl ester carboxylesterase